MDITNSIEKFKIRAEEFADSPAVQRVVIAAEASPKIPISFSLAIVVIGVAIAPLWGWHTSRTTAAWWRAEIARVTAPPTNVVNAGNIEAVGTDDDVIKSLGDSYAKYQHGAQALIDAGLDGPDPCALLPRRCVRK